MAKRQGHNSWNDRHHIASTSFPRRDHDAGRNSTVMAPINRSQTYPARLIPCKSRKELANWTWVRLGNPRPKPNNLEGTEQRHWQGHIRNTDNETLEGPGDTAGSEAVEEEEQIQSDMSEISKERPGISLEDLE